MSEWPVSLLEPLPVMHPWALESLGDVLYSQAVGLNLIASAAWPVANTCLIFPFRLQRPMRAATWFWMNGGTLGGNVDVGILDARLQRLYSLGATAQVGISAMQTAAVAGTPRLPAGAYYLAMSCDSATATVQRVAPAGAGVAGGGGLRVTGHPIPSSAAAAILINVNYVPLFGFSSRSFV